MRRLGDADQRRAQQAVGDHVARLHDLGDRAGRVLGGLDLEHRLVAVVVEAAAELGLDLGDLMALEAREQALLGQRDAIGQRAHEVDLLARAGRDAGQRAAQVVGHLEQLAGEAGDRVFVRLLDLARRAPAQVLGLGERTQQALLGRLELGRELGLGRPCLLGSAAGWVSSAAVCSSAAFSTPSGASSSMCRLV